MPSQRPDPTGSSGNAQTRDVLAQVRLAGAQNLDQWVEDPAEQIMRADRLVYVEQVEAEKHEDEIGDDDPGKSRHWRAPKRSTGGQSTLKARYSKATGLLQLDA